MQLYAKYIHTNKHIQVNNTYMYLLNYTRFINLLLLNQLED